jgi:phycocyanin-associated rod linker protein
LSAAERLGIKAFEEARRVELRPQSTQDDATAVIRAGYSQVFGNEYLMSIERLTSAESLRPPRGRFQ